MLRLVGYALGLVLVVVPVACFVSGFFLGLGSRGMMVVQRYAEKRRALAGPPYHRREERHEGQEGQQQRALLFRR